MTAPAPDLQPDPAAVGDLHARLRADAALRDSFRPAEMLGNITGGPPKDDLVIAAALSALLGDCTVSRDAEGQSWTLRPAVRRKVLSSMPGEQALAADTSVTRALSGTAGYQPQAIRRLVSYSEGDRPPPAAVLARRLHTLERAGPTAPAHSLVAGLRGALNTAENSERAAQLLSNGIFGREVELATIRDWIGHPQDGAPVRCLHISGLPGIGKSYLLQSAVQEARGSGAGVLTIWLDFDRSGLSVTDATAFFEEISRQIGDALPSSAGGLRDIRLQAARERTALSSREAGYALPRHLLSAMGTLVAAQNRPVLIVLDTLEVLRARGETAVVRLFEYLDRLAEAGVAPLSVLSAGRGDALDPVPERKAADVRLLAFPDPVAAAFLAAQDVPEVARPAILGMAGGIPLLLKLGARAHADGLSLADPIPDSPDAAGAYLYRAVLSRLDPPLNDLAQAGLVLHRLRPEHLVSILAPALGLALNQDQAEALFHDLATHHWLVEAEPSGSWLRHRSDIRAAFLPLLYRDQPALARRVNERAAAVLAITDPDAALYHNLQLTRAGLPLPGIDPLLATRLTAGMIEELPPPARNAVKRARGERSGDFRAAPPQVADVGGEQDFIDTTDAVSTEVDQKIVGIPGTISTPGTDMAAPLLPKALAIDHQTGRLETRAGISARPLDPRLIADLRLMLANGDRREATYLIDTALAAPFVPGDPGAVVILGYLWLSGAWASSLRLWRGMGAPNNSEDPFVARILREIEAEARFVTARNRLATLPPPPSSGRSAMLGAAYDIAIITGGRPDAIPAMTDGTIRAAALLSPWLPGLGDGAATRMAAEADVRRERAGLHLTPYLPDALRPGTLIAPLIPHVVQLTALATDRWGAARAGWLAALTQRLPDILRLQAPWVGITPETIARAAQTPFDMLDLLAASGLLSDAATAMALVLDDAELTRLAASVERWRRLSHGLWSLSPRPPRGWQGHAGLDAATAHLTKRLIDHPADAANLVALWCDTAPARARLDRRSLGHLPTDGPDARAEAALSCGLPCGLAAALSVLATPYLNQPT
jgi:hypothetical protein